ncbi:PAP2 superfamily protein [bacterium BMS3Abin03]|nr:PAP2 superfamily protein [bacterium BMS3Abin03]
MNKLTFLFTSRQLKYLSLFIIILFIQSFSFGQSPYKLNLTTEGIIFGSGLIIAGIAFPTNDDIHPLTVSEISELRREGINKFDRGATYNWLPSAGRASNVLLVTSLLSPGLLAISSEIRSDFTPVLTMYLETLMFSEALPFLLKGLTRRIRPFAYNGDAPLEVKQTKGVKRSYFSGHATAAFAMAVFVSTVYSDYYPNSGWKPFVWAGSLALAATVGVLRYSAGLHFPTDIITGALVGSAVGYLIPFVHRVENENLNISTGFNSSGSFIMVNYKF